MAATVQDVSVLETNEYRLIITRDPQTLKHLSTPKIFKHKTVDEAQEHAQRLLKTLKHHDVSIWAPPHKEESE